MVARCALVLLAVLTGLGAVAAADGVDAEPAYLVASSSSLMVFDENATLLSYRAETFQWWQTYHVAVNPRNGTVCWVWAPEDQGLPGLVRCAPVSNLTAGWDLPRPRGLRVNKMNAITLDWVTDTWHFTESRSNYVCSYNFSRCAQVGKSAGNVRFYAAYDVPNRLMFLITTEGAGAYRLEVARLDGTDRRILPTRFEYPSGMAVDPQEKKVYWFDPIYFATGVFRCDYDGENKELVAKLEHDGIGKSYKRAMHFVGDTVYIVWFDQRKVSAIDKRTKQRTDLMDGAVESICPGAVPEGVAQPDLADVGGLAAIKAYAKSLQPSLENWCSESNGGCTDLCVPTVVNGSASRTCICEPGFELVDTACFEIRPATVLVVNKLSLQAVDVDTEAAATILTGLKNATKADFFWAGGDEYVLFWLDDGGLFRGHWSRGGRVADVVPLVPAGGTVRAVEVTVDWNQRNVLWIEWHTQKGTGSGSMKLKMANVNGTDARTLVADGRYRSNSALITQSEGMGVTFSVSPFYSGFEFKNYNMNGAKEYAGFGSYLERQGFTFQPREVAADLSAVSSPHYMRYLWVNTTVAAVDFISRLYLLDYERGRLLTDPSLSSAGGLDVFDDRLFWTDRNAGLLMTADSRSGEGVRPVTGSDGTSEPRGVRVLHPRKQPSTRQVVCDEQNNGCSDMCILVFVNWHREGLCACPDGKTLEDDGHTCQ